MKSLEGTATRRNLLAAFAGESQARNRYEFFAKKARKEGYVRGARIIEEIALQERSHAKSFYKLLEGEDLEITEVFPAGGIRSTEQNLRRAIEGERRETETLYPGYAAVAQEEGFGEIAALFRSIAVAERYHLERFEGLLELIEGGESFRAPGPVRWTCSKCGYIFDGEEPPPRCPACDHPRDYFERAPGSER